MGISVEKRKNDKQCRSRWDGSSWAISSGSYTVCKGTCFDLQAWKVKDNEFIVEYYKLKILLWWWKCRKLHVKIPTTANVWLQIHESQIWIPARPHGDWLWNHYSGHVSSSTDSRRAVSQPRWLSWMCRLTGDRRSRVQPLPRQAAFFRGYWSWNIFYGHSLPSTDSRRAVVSFWRKNVHNTG